MTKQVINVGTTANDKQGDSLRTAFQKVNANFTELYAASSISFPSQTGNNGKYLTTNGTTLSWATVSVPTDINQLADASGLIPTDVNQLADASGLLGTANAVVSIGSTAPASPTSGQLWYDTVGGRMYIYYSSAWVDANP